jgi:hypothetical protein
MCSGPVASQSIANTFHRQDWNVGVYARVVLQKHQLPLVEILNELPRVAGFMGKLLDRRTRLIRVRPPWCMSCPRGGRGVRLPLG